MEFLGTTAQMSQKFSIEEHANNDTIGITALRQRNERCFSGCLGAEFL